MTAQRLAVMRAISLAPHSTAEAICDAVRADIGAISRQAVYDALNMLVGKGLLRRIEPGRSPAVYECRVEDNHHHLICRQCGKAVDIEVSVGEAPSLTARQSAGFQVERAEIIYWGTCPECIE